MRWLNVIDEGCQLHNGLNICKWYGTDYYDLVFKVEWRGHMVKFDVLRMGYFNEFESVPTMQPTALAYCNLEKQMKLIRGECQ